MPKKMPKAQRRAQLLETAREMVRESGTDALSLGSLAERAGVSKPITYNHFGTRAGLLIALYREINEQQVRATQEALDNAPPALAEVARLLAEAYMDCHEEVGPEFHVIGGALKGDPEMETYERDMLDEHIAHYANVLKPFSNLSGPALQRSAIAILGAADALADAMARRRISKEDAVGDLAALIMSTVGRS
ncbi:TetR/AcrR family transcriptional regulator (plasmid) [Martelella lutilitoris]|uniref:TetR/AcrR family transcriptional regulator n=1 Tax=Martelella lutilitoris TaxID=2583532 RepID=A0A7T7HPH0_9HYPH|nr:TetR/AcrR family transcriptional regulator [Martelella lutilitoris]QQM32981.1 TetR/AcrR family transcriptional regulator [Martelella lutilitoris]QRX65323.1 TetR/AcrR family transcriptional regulator [Dysgonomonadaceae bacterium zrk40]